jgi:hypothetical protein
VQAAGGVHQDHVMRGKLCFANRAAHDFERLVGARAGPARHVDRLGHLRKLLARRGTVHVGGNHDRPVAVRGKPLGQLAGGGGFARTLQADDQPHRGRARREKRLGVLAEQQRQLIAHDLDDLLVGRKLQQHFGAQRFLANVRQQFIDYADVDVAFEQRFADSGQRFVHVLLREFSLSAQVLENSLQFVCQILKHQEERILAVRQRAMHDLDEFPEISRHHFGRLGRAPREIVISFVNDDGARVVGDHDAIRILIEVGKFRAAKASIDHIERLHVRNKGGPKSKTGAPRKDNAARFGRMRFILLFKIANRRFPSLREHAPKENTHTETEQ